MDDDSTINFDELRARIQSEREFLYTQDDFAHVCALIYQRAGISLSASKKDLVYGRLSRRLRATHHQSFADYLVMLDDADAPEWEFFTNALTTNLTSFFREKHHFDMLAAYLRQHGGHDTLRLWSAAASTGEEAYSIAITVADTLHRANDVVKILATDIDTHVIEHGRKGVYPVERIEDLGEEQRRRYFQRGSGANDGKVRVSERLRNMISFKRLNLLAEHWPMRNKFDVVFLRNVLIYFDKPTQASLLAHLGQVIKPGGLLFIGHSESPPMDRRVFEPAGRTAYRVHGASHG